MNYNIWNAVAYEVTNLLIDFDSRWPPGGLSKLSGLKPNGKR